jgi:hypothetical protein
MRMSEPCGRTSTATVPSMDVMRKLVPLTAAMVLVGCGSDGGSTESTTARSTTTTESRRPTLFELADARDGVTLLAAFTECVIGPLDELSFIISYYLPIGGVDFETIPGGFRCIALVTDEEAGGMSIAASTDISQVDTALAGAVDVIGDNMYAGQILVTCADEDHCLAFWVSPDDDFYVEMQLSGDDLDPDWMRKKMRLVLPVVLGQIAATVDNEA